MQGRKLTQELAAQINGVYVSPETFINVVYDINDNPFIFISEQWEENLAGTEFAYLLEIPKEEYTPKPEEDMLNRE